jgi:hypothetical protein
LGKRFRRRKNGETPLPRELSRTRTRRSHKHDLRFQAAPHIFQPFKIHRALKGLIMLRQYHSYLFTAKLILGQNGSQHTLPIIIRGYIYNANIRATRVTRPQKIRTIALSHLYISSYIRKFGVFPLL